MKRTQVAFFAPIAAAKLIAAGLVIACGTSFIGCGGGGTVGNPPPPPPTASLTASASSINSGQSVDLTYACGNSTSATASAAPGVSGWNGSLAALSGKVTVAPTATTTFNLSCAGNGGTTNAAPVTVTVNAPPPPPTASLSASAPAITSGQSVDLTYACGNSTSATASSAPVVTGWNGVLATLSGKVTVTPSATATYNLSCKGAGGTTNAAPVTVTVNAPPPPPTASLSASSTTITQGQSVNLTWACGNSTSATASASPAEADWTGTLPTLSGTKAVAPSATAVFSLSCTGAGGTTNATPVTVTVNAAGATATSVTPAFVWMDIPLVSQIGNPTVLTLNGAGILSSDLCEPTLGGLTLAVLSRPATTSTTMPCGIGIDSGDFIQAYGTLKDCRSGNVNCSSAPLWGFAGNGGNQMVASSSGIYYAITTGALTDADHAANLFGTLFRFDSSGVKLGSANVGSKMGIAFNESATAPTVTLAGCDGNDLQSSCQLAVYAANADSQFAIGGASSIGRLITSVAGGPGVSCAALPHDQKGVCIDTTVAAPTPRFTAAGQLGTAPVAVAISGTDMVAYSRDGQFSRVNNTTMANAMTPTTIAGLGATDHFQLKVSGTGVAMLLDEEQHVVVFITASTGAELRRVTLPTSSTQATLALDVDAANSAALVVRGDTGNGQQSLIRVPVAAPAPGNPSFTVLTSTSTTFPAGVVINPVSKEAGIFGQGVLAHVPNQ